MRFFILFLFIYSLSVFAAEYTYEPPIEAEVSDTEFSIWQQELIKKIDDINDLVGTTHGIDSVNLSDRYLNRLIFEPSPYLQRHALNPIDWHAWHDEALAKAKLENKLIFLSIGYSTCHWCHVMEKESFTNLNIAKTLNKRFISIKVDRELTPDVDRYFTQALMLTKGNAGWPINAILTPSAEVIWLDSYLTPDNFIKTVSRLSKVWQVRPEAVKQAAKNIASQLKTQNDFTDIAWDINKSMQLVELLINNLDEVHGGLAGDRKFPNAAALQLLIYQYQLKPNVMLGQHIKRFLDKLINGGIRDHVNGGFYRYATDAKWQQPHFEKMLYNQALLISVFSKAYTVFKDEHYKALVIDTIDFLRNWFESVDGGYFSGIDADYLGREGRYYAYSPQELSLIEQSNLNQFSWCNFNSNAYKFPCSLKSNDKIDNAKHALQAVKSELVRPHVDRKVITAWNALMISAFVDAYTAFDEDLYLNKAIKLANIISKRHVSRSGLLMRVRYQNKLAGKAVLSDYAYLASAMFTLFKTTQNQKWYQLSVQLYQQGSMIFDEDFQREGGLGGGQLDDGELISAHTVLISLGDKLKRHGEKNLHSLKPQVLQLKQAAMNSNGGDFSLHEFFLKNKFGVFDNIQFFAKGKGYAQLSRHNNEVIITLSLANGWHINSHQPRQKFLIPTALTSKKNVLDKIQYPKAEIKKLGFSQAKLSLFEGSFQITAGITNASELGEQIALSLQACSDKLCLLPETLTFYISN